MKYIFLFFLSLNAFAFVEVNGSFWYDKQVFGGDDQSITRSRTYSVFLAWYVFRLTAIEINYSETDDTIIDSGTVSISGTAVDITSTENIVLTNVYGIGIRQALAPRNSFMVPTISVGYARQTISGETNYVFRSQVDGSTSDLKVENEKEVIDSSFATFALRFNVTRFFGISGSIRTVVPGTRFSESSNNLRYEAGISWIF